MHFCYGPMTRYHPRDGFVDRLQEFGLPPPCYPSYEASDSYLGGSSYCLPLNMPAFAGRTTVLEPLDSHGSSQPCICLLREQTFFRRSSSSWLPSWLNPPSSCVIPLAPRPLQTLPRYYRMIRHLQVHRYFPFVVPTYRFSLSIT